MVRKGLKIKLGRPMKAKRSRELGEVDENQNNAKKTKADEAINPVELFEYKFKDFLSTAISLFNNRGSNEFFTLEERLSYYQILRSLTSSYCWKKNRIVSNSLQLQCIARDATIEKEEDKRNLMMSMHQFVEFKLKSFPGHSLSIRAHSVAKHFQNELAVYGVTLEKLRCAIEDIEKAMGKIPTKSKAETKSQDNNMYKNVCRLCGSKRKLIVDITKDQPLRNIVSLLCRITVEESSSLPQLVCERCVNHIDSFYKYSKKIIEFQKELQKNSNTSISLDHIKSEASSDYDDYGSDVISNNDFFVQEYYPKTSIQATKTFNFPSLNNSSDDDFAIISSSLLEEMDHESNHNSLSDHEDNASSGFGSNEDIQSVPYTASSAMPPCHILLERLPIKYVSSDDEENLEIEKQSPRRSKRGRPRAAIPPSLEIDFEEIFKSNPNLTNKTFKDAICLPIQEKRVKQEKL